jgi:hypothetical protein
MQVNNRRVMTTIFCYYSARFQLDLPICSFSKSKSRSAWSEIYLDKKIDKVTSKEMSAVQVQSERPKVLTTGL